MLKEFAKLMLVTNEPANSTGAERTAMNFAVSCTSSVLIVDTIKTPFIASKSRRLSSDQIYETAIGAKNRYLENLRSDFENLRIDASTKVLLGPRTSVELINTAIQQKCDLVIRYLKGQSSWAGGRFGETAKNLMRNCPVPVLLTDQEISDPNVLACINLDHGPEENQSILDNARRIASSLEKIFVIACWEFEGKDFLIDFVDSGLNEQSSAEAESIYQTMFERLKVDYDLEHQQQLTLHNGSPKLAIPRYCKDNNIDIAVMCSASLNHPIGRKLGSTIERTIGNLPCALLAVKPYGFNSQMDQELAAQVEQSTY